MSYTSRRSWDAVLIPMLSTDVCSQTAMSTRAAIDTKTFPLIVRATVHQAPRFMAAPMQSWLTGGFVFQYGRNAHSPSAELFLMHLLTSIDFQRCAVMITRFILIFNKHQFTYPSSIFSLPYPVISTITSLALTR